MNFGFDPSVGDDLRTPQDILIERAGGAMRLRINRPQVHNACRQQTTAELNAALTDAARDDAIKVVVLCGAGTRAFCAGADLREIAKSN